MSTPNSKSREFIEDSGDESEGASGSGSDSDNIDRVVPDVSTKRPAKSGADAYPKFEPVRGLYPITVSATYSSPFELNSIASKPGVELWAIRVPRDVGAAKIFADEQFKVTRLNNLSLDPSRGIGTLNTSSVTYRLREAGPSTPRSTAVTNEGRDVHAGPGMVDAMMDEESELSTDGGQEMAGMRLLVPSQKTGKLSAGADIQAKLMEAPIPLSRKFILSAVEEKQAPPDHDLPSFLSTSTSLSDTGPPLKRKQPLHLLAFRNRACGFDTPGPKRSRTEA